MREQQKRNEVCEERVGNILEDRGVFVDFVKNHFEVSEDVRGAIDAPNGVEFPVQIKSNHEGI